MKRENSEKVLMLVTRMLEFVINNYLRMRKLIVLQMMKK